MSPAVLGRRLSAEVPTSAAPRERMRSPRAARALGCIFTTPTILWSPFSSKRHITGLESSRIPPTWCSSTTARSTTRQTPPSGPASSTARGPSRRRSLRYCLSLEQINPFCGLYRRDPFLKAGGWDEDPRILQSEDQAGHLRLALAGLKFDADPTYAVINYIRGRVDDDQQPPPEPSAPHTSL